MNINPTLIKWWFRYVDYVMMSTVPPGKIKSTNFKSTSIP